MPIEQSRCLAVWVLTAGFNYRALYVCVCLLYLPAWFCCITFLCITVRNVRIAFIVHRFRAKCQQQDRIHFRQSGEGGHLYHLYHLYEDTVSQTHSKIKQEEDMVTLPPADTALDIATPLYLLPVQY